MRFFTRLLFCFVGFSLIPATLFVIAYYASVHRAEQHMLEQGRQSLATSAVYMEEQFAGICAMVERLSGEREIIAYLARPDKAAAMEASRALYYAAAGKNDMLAVYAISAEQAQGVGTAPIPALYAHPDNRNWGVRRMMDESPELVMRLAEHSATEGKDTVLTFGKRVSVGGRAVGYVVVEVKRTLLAETYPGLSDSVTYIYSDNHLIYSSAPRESEGLGRVPALVREHEHDGSGVYGPDRNGKVAISYAPIWGGRFSVARVTSLEGVEKAFGYLRWGFSITIALLFVLSPVLAFTVAAGVTRPIRDMTAALHQVERGNFDVRVTAGRADEIGEMGDTFNLMTGQIKELINRVREKQLLLDVAKNRALLAQVNPHFLYNTLDLIKWASKMGNMNAVSTVTVNLGRLLRAIVNIHEDMIPLRREMEIVDFYINIQKLRYGDRLNFSTEIPDELLDKQVPRLLLQPLVENAIEHGLQNMDGQGTLTVRAAKQGAYLVFSVIDNGAGFPDDFDLDQEPLPGALRGIGVVNVHSRARLYGDEQCGLAVGRDADGRTVVAVTVLDTEEQCITQ